MFNLNGGGLGLLAMAMMVATLIVHFMLALYVWNDSIELTEKGRTLVFFGPYLWTTSVMLSGIVAAGFYWIIHHSAMSDVDHESKT